MKLLYLPLAVAIATPAAAQDTPGAIDLSALSRSQVQSAMADGYAERGGKGWTRGPNGVMLSAKSRAYCDGFPALRSRHGANDPRVTRLASACRRAGYDY